MAKTIFFLINFRRGDVTKTRRQTILSFRYCGKMKIYIQHPNIFQHTCLPIVTMIHEILKKKKRILEARDSLEHLDGSRCWNTCTRP